MASAADTAAHLIRLAAADPEGEPMTAMRLHKLLYYCQGWHLAWYGRPLFPEPLEAWKYGPVVPTVYARPWVQGRDPLPVPEGETALTAAERAAVEQVWSHYRRYSACGLRDKTHGERPWAVHYAPDGNGPCSQEIPPADLMAYFGDEFRRTTGEEPGSAAADGVTVSHDRLLEELGW